MAILTVVDTIKLPAKTPLQTANQANQDTFG
jgi:hypothetical protein